MASHTRFILRAARNPSLAVDHRRMAQILISEPHPDVRRLLERMAIRLGHTPVVADVASAEQLRSADVLLVEPASPVGMALVQAASIAVPSLPIVCASVTAPPPEIAQLGVSFAATLIKPFTIDQLGAAIERALRLRRGRNNSHYRNNQDAA